MREKVYEVYICKYDGEIVYIGEGALNRHRHCTSGASHVYELNEIFFTKDKSLFDVSVRFVDSKEKASRIEKELIETHRPKYNKVGVSNERNIKGVNRALFRKLLLSKVDSVVSTSLRKVKLKVAVEEFLTFHTSDRLQQEGLLLRGHGKYRNMGLLQLSSIVGNLKEARNTSKEGLPHLFREIIEISYLEHFGVESKVSFI